MSEASNGNADEVDTMNNLDDLGKAKELADKFINALAKEADLFPSSFEMPPVWLMGTILNISLPQQDFEKLKTNIDGASERSSLILREWFEEDEEAMYVHMSTEVWQGTRRDHYKGSRLNSMKNGVPANSPHLIQTIRLTSAVDGSAPMAHAVDKVLSSYTRYQLIVHFLRMSVKMGPGDIGTFIGYLSEVEVDDSLDSDMVIARARHSEERAMLQSAGSAILHAQKKGYSRRLDAILDPKRLGPFDKIHKISFTDRSFDGKWAVVVTIPGDEAAATLKKHQPSFFVTWTEDLGFESQVHILDVKVYKGHYCMLVSCSREPSAEDADSMLEELQQKLGLPASEKAWVTAPIKKSDPSWFRADGVLYRGFKKTINSAAKAVIDCGLLSEGREEGLLFVGSDPTPWSFSVPKLPSRSGSKPNAASDASSDAGLQPELDPDPSSKSDSESGSESDSDTNSDTGATPERQPCTWLIWLRQSEEDGVKARSTIPRQLTTALSSELLWQRRPGDRICIYVEVCSSNKHSWDERKLPQCIPRDWPIMLMTVNPDRATRRPEEVDPLITMVSEMPGGAWYTRGLPTEVDASNEEWVRVEEDLAEILKERLAIGRQKALGTGEFIRSDIAMTRLNDLMSRSPKTPAQILALQAAIQHVFKIHGFKKILLVARNCPMDLKVEKDCLNTSIIRQLQFLRNMLAAGLDPETVVEWKAMGLSAYTDEFVDGLAEQLEDHGSNVLVLTVRLDHMTRSPTQLARLTDVLAKGGHGAMSFHWDYKTRLDVSEAFQVDQSQGKHHLITAWDDALTEQQRAAPARVSLPMVQPILWILGNDDSETVRRHVNTAEQWSQSVKMSAYQGDDYVDEAFAQRGPAQIGFSNETQKL